MSTDIYTSTALEPPRFIGESHSLDRSEEAAAILGDNFASHPWTVSIAREIIERDLLTGEWQSVRQIANRLSWPTLSVPYGSVLGALEGLCARRFAYAGERHGPSAFATGNYVYRLASEDDRHPGLCRECGGHRRHVWAEKTPEGNYHAHTGDLARVEELELELRTFSHLMKGESVEELRDELDALEFDIARPEDQAQMLHDRGIEASERRAAGAAGLGL